VIARTGALISGFLVAGCAAVQASGGAVPPVVCSAASAPIDARMCLGDELKRAEEALATRLQVARLRAPNPTLVDSAQAAWLAYRRAQCEAEGEEYAGGTLEPVQQLECRVRLTRDRIDEVAAMYRST